MKTTWMIWLVLASAVACSADRNDRLDVGREPGAAGTGGRAGASGGAAAGRDGGLLSATLDVRVEDSERMKLEVVTLACAGDCAVVKAVASGGKPPYAFRWDDGSTSEERTVCLERSGQLSVTAEDTADDDDEFPYAGQTATTTLTATVLDCMDGDAAVSDCGEGATPPFLVVDKQVSTPMATWAQMNGSLPDYAAPSFGGNAFAIIATTTQTVELGSCKKLLLAGDAAGTKAVGWDDTLIVEYRSVPSGPVDKRWYYGSVAVTYTPDNQTLPSGGAPTVPGLNLDPPVPNPLPFGYEPLVLDLMSEIPSGADGFELTIHVLDASFTGSTTDIWVIPQ